MNASLWFEIPWKVCIIQLYLQILWMYSINVSKYFSTFHTWDFVILNTIVEGIVVF